jgi:hypothetical protein
VESGEKGGALSTVGPVSNSPDIRIAAPRLLDASPRLVGAGIVHKNQLVTLILVVEGVGYLAS